MQKFDYRADIDGLRALAVLLIVLFHINEGLVPGGFIGVDIFFVISGYLITGNIVREHERGTFAFGEFYRRRIRRILPAMLVVTFTSVIVGTLLLLPEDVVQLAWSALATAASGANIFFTYFLDASYFAPASNTVPLLHMWSLGVEEQFYVLWPFFLILLLKWRRLLLPILLFVIAISVIVGEWQLRTGNLEWAYYMLPSRAFQLAMGGALIFLPQVGRNLSWVLAPAGLLLVLACAFVLSETTPFPGFNAVPVTIGTAALLASGVHTTLFTKALSLPPLRAIGLISYSLYLWHWPVLAFQRYFYGDLDAIQQVLSFVAMMGLAAASYFFVEVPFRQSQAPFRQILLRFALAPAAALSVLATALIATNGYGPYRYSDYPKLLTRLAPAVAANTLDYVCQRSLLRPDDLIGSKCVIGQGEPRILLYGDSHAAHYIGIIGELARKDGISFRNFAHSACVPIDSDPTPFVSSRYLRSCRDSHRIVAEHLTNYDVIFIGASWQNYSDTGSKRGANLGVELQSFVNKLVSAGTRVVLLDTVPWQPKFDPRCTRKAVKVATIDCAALGATASAPEFTKELYSIAARTNGVTVLSIRELVCQFNRCPAFDADGTALYYDRSHLSVEGSWRIGKRLTMADQKSSVVEVLRSLEGGRPSSR